MRRYYDISVMRGPILLKLVLFESLYAVYMRKISLNIENIAAWWDINEISFGLGWNSCASSKDTRQRQAYTRCLFFHVLGVETLRVSRLASRRYRVSRFAFRFNTSEEEVVILCKKISLEYSIKVSDIALRSQKIDLCLHLESPLLNVNIESWFICAIFIILYL